MIIGSLSGRSSGVERNLAKVEVEGSNPFARSKFYPKTLLRDTSGTVDISKAKTHNLDTLNNYYNF